ncbi:histidinol-phosphatase HisJ [Halalkalibacter okhensis]|uniref:Histidinol-phosphatase n=1 Tax=Halalkalibacter okhensis TaxID=333138 RepID=A0A0B0IIY6_9BACI|nr:histidinol-phosphatase HisJ [Halalkalibacter okhensis]KHF39636.1 histidinol phosphatase [Halalkalibacter okhensis]
MIHDGHVHSPYCPHGTKDSFEKYCELAIQLNIQGITFTEHAPLPPGFQDPTPLKDSGMDGENLHDYFKEIEALKSEYEGHLTICTGLEIDFIEGFEKETLDFLNEIGPMLDDSILSVHFLKIKDEFVCIDYSPDVFSNAITQLGSVEAVHKLYYETVSKSIETHLGRYKPKRIGHITLARKFNRTFPVSDLFAVEIDRILHEMKKKGYELDYNGAGCIKPLCKEPYPYELIIKKAIELGIPLVYGSDAHQAKSLLSGVDQLYPKANVTKPQSLL